jgi:signal transduction histidine kinase/amino acid transporter/CheY-like chemotaxis protein
LERGDSQGVRGGGLTRYLSPINVWALSFGCIVGWGAFVMPGTQLLPLAGPVGTIVAIGIGAVAMSVIAVNIQCMANRYPDSGGAFSYTKHVFGYDHAFLCSWSLVLAYVSIMWANATAFILIGRYLLGHIFQVGFHYEVAGYDVYLGEIAVTLAILVLFGFLSTKRKRVVKTLNTALALLLVLGTVACFVIVLVNDGGNPASFAPPFAPTGSAVTGIVGIVALAPWAFIGFESISHAVGEMKFSHKRLLPILIAAIASGALVYILATLISVLGTPGSYGSWADYVSNLGNYKGVGALPTFQAVRSALGRPGLVLLSVVVLSALATSLIGLYRAASRLIYNIAIDGLLPEWFGRLDDEGVPRNAILFIILISFVAPFVGRAAIGWIVDVTTVSASIAYSYISACSLRVAREENLRAIKVTSIVGIVLSAAFFIYPLVPNFWSGSTLAPESYLILTAWSIIGLGIFRAVFQRDTGGRFGKSTIVWMAMLSLIFFASTMWVRQATRTVTEETVVEVDDYYQSEYKYHGIKLSDRELVEEEMFLERETEAIRSALLGSSLVQVALIAFSLAIMFSIFSLLRKREKETDAMRLAAEATSKAKTLFLSNMSHDIRTPMNAIIGYTNIAKRDGLSPEEVRGYLDKIDSSSKHLLALINDVLEMSRIESGKMELDPVECDLRRTMDEVRDMFATQMQEKRISFVVDTSGVRDGRVLCDVNRLNRVLLNLISNAYKFTPEGGEVKVTLAQAQDAPDGWGRFELRIKDTGIGMSREFAERVFEAFERERNTTVSGTQGTGLGMAITKNIVDLMGGTIEVVTAPGEGTEFTIDLSLELVGGEEEPAQRMAEEDRAREVDFSARRLLLVEDNEINRDIATLILEEAGFSLETAENGKVAVEKVRTSQPGYYDAILMDVQMPVMNGYEATRAIRALDDPGLSRIPILAVTANAFSEDVQNAREAGMDGHLSKPLDVPKVLQTLGELFGRQRRA